MLKKFYDAHRLVAADLRDAAVDSYNQIVEPDADKDAAFFAVATKKLCAAAIFCEVVMVDGRLAEGETERIRDLLLVRFGLNNVEADALFKMGQQVTADRSRLPRMTASVREHFDLGERIELIEMLFDMSYSDGEQNPREVEIAEQAGSAIGLQSKDIARARLKIAERRQKLQSGMKLGSEY